MYLCLAFVCAVIGLSSSVQAATPVSVAVYYESLCPDSIKFYTTQLYPTMEIKSLSNNIDLVLVPYGKSQHEKLDNGSWAFHCHHGEKECYGNKVHACALRHMASKNERLTFINCLMKTIGMNKDAEFPTTKCAEQISAEERSAILNCANGTRGDDDLAAMGNKTAMLQPKLTSVPTIVFNSAYNQNDQTQAQTNFKGILCKYIPSPKPAECAGTSSATMSSSMATLLYPAFLYLVYRTLCDAQ